MSGKPPLPPKRIVSCPVELTYKFPFSEPKTETEIQIYTFPEIKNQIYTFFWKPHDINGEFSNWYFSEFIANGPYEETIIKNKKFNCVEQYFMAKKAILFGDEIACHQIIMAKNPKIMKNLAMRGSQLQSNCTPNRVGVLGRQVSNFNEKVWHICKEKIMYQGLFYKFSQNKHLQEKLMSCKGPFVEASPFDNVWGIGMTSNDTRANNSHLWNGSNLLGKLLTKLKNEFINLYFK